MNIAITGTIGSGKTAVSNYLRSLGYKVFDCDKYNASLLQEGSYAYPLIKELFPECFINNKLDKKALASIIFENPQRKKALEKILHPLIISKMKNEMLNTTLFFAEVPLLFENDLDRYFDLNVLVVCEQNIALERLVKRGLSKDDALRRIKNQMSVKNKMLRANEIIYNNDTLGQLHTKVDELLEKYVR